MAEGQLFPAIEPYRTAFLPVSARHNRHVENEGMRRRLLEATEEFKRLRP